jgi:very-short-patch-repair endonuclease
MSPLSVSTYLEGGYEFDAVIFDEASQVPTEEAIGAIYRAKQVIITGDSKQLPPTGFFGALMSRREDDAENEDEDAAEVGAFKSLLDEAVSLPSRMLLWHYRSRHEDLIAFSNAKLYDKKLITFPSAVENGEDLGVQYIHVSDGIYDRGGKNGNLKEAEKVAELAFEHFRKNPERSLGIIAFGAVQQNAIIDALERKRKKNRDFEHYFREDSAEPVFIKNLENVQGDERDTIIFSIGYARDASGKFIMNFGPLTQTGGERRLNVAITRARYNVKLVGSILLADIKVEKTENEGPKLLRSYIDFAINGSKVLFGGITENRETVFDSPFEKAVYNFLTTHGYDAATQVGCSSYRIDIAIRHPNYPGHFAIGIECDGAAYHSARTARERDRLRQAVLEDMGWTIYRVWSTDWIKDPKTEGEKLLNAVKEAIANYHETATPPQKPVPTPDDLTVSDNPETNTELQQTDFAEAAVQLELDMPKVTQETLKQAFSMLNAKERDHKHEKTYKEKCRSLYKDIEAIKDILNTGTVDAETKRQFQAVTLAIQTL